MLVIFDKGGGLRMTMTCDVFVKVYSSWNIKFKQESVYLHKNLAKWYFKRMYNFIISFCQENNLPEVLHAVCNTSRTVSDL